MNELETKDVFRAVLLPMRIAVAAVMVIVIIVDRGVLAADELDIVVRVDVVELLDSVDVTVDSVRISVVSSRVVSSVVVVGFAVDVDSAVEASMVDGDVSVDVADTAVVSIVFHRVVLGDFFDALAVVFFAFFKL